MIKLALKYRFRNCLIAPFSLAVGLVLSPSVLAKERVTFSAELGEVKAEFWAETGEYCIDKPQIKIERQGQTELEAPLSDYIYDEGMACRVLDLVTQDLDGDGDPEVILDFYSGGAHCCSTTVIYSYNPDRRRYSAINHYWGNGGYTLEDLNGDGIPEFNSRDDNFAYAFTDYAASRYPIQIWQYEQYAMHDVTRNFPNVVYGHALQLWQEYSSLRDKRSSGLSPEEIKRRPQVEQAVLAAYLANKYLLGQEEDGWHRLWRVYWWRDRHDFFGSLDGFLRRTGYIPEF